MAKSQVPTFGNWETEQDVPYTAYFDNPRKGKKVGKMNPDEPHNDLDAEPKGSQHPQSAMPKHEHTTSQDEGDQRTSTDSTSRSIAKGQKTTTEGGTLSESETPKSLDARRPKHENRLSQEESYPRKATESPLRHESAGRRTSSDSPLHRHGGTSASDTPRRVNRQSVGSDRSIEHSPLHPNAQGRVAGKGVGISSPSWERKGSSEGSHGQAPSTPGRSRLRSVTRGSDTPDHSPAVPKFGEWDESDPASAEGYTHIFNRVRQEKQSGEGKVPAMPTESPYSNGQKQYGNENSKSCCCFPRSRR